MREMKQGSSQEEDAHCSQENEVNGNARSCVVARAKVNYV